MTDGFALKSWVISLFNKASKRTNKYSTTEETVVGTWIDGKPIYRKVIYSTTTSGEEQQVADIANLNIDTFIHGNARFRGVCGWTGYFNSQYYFAFQLGQSNGAKTILMTMSGWPAGDQLVLILEYTKTTDKATN